MPGSCVGHSALTLKGRGKIDLPMHTSQTRGIYDSPAAAGTKYYKVLQSIKENQWCWSSKYSAHILRTDTWFVEHSASSESTAQWYGTLSKYLIHWVRWCCLWTQLACLYEVQMFPCTTIAHLNKCLGFVHCLHYSPMKMLIQCVLLIRRILSKPYPIIQSYAL